jgi:hypothetical protein
MLLSLWVFAAAAGVRADILLAGAPDPDEPDFQLWLAADAGTFEDALGSDPAEAGDEILMWANQANSTTPDALRGVVNAGPTLAVADWDGQPTTVLEFLGNQTLVVDDDLDQLDPGTGGFTIIAVARQTWPLTIATDYWLGKNNAGPTVVGYSISGGFDDELRVRVNGGTSLESNKAAQTHAHTLNRPTVLSMVLTGSEVFGFVDGSPAGWSDGGDDGETASDPIDNDYIGSVATATPFIVGGRGSTNQNLEFIGDFAELLVYSRELSPADRQAVEGYLAGKYGITLAGSLVSSGDTWIYLDDGGDPGPTWLEPGFADGTWSTGASPLGYGNGDEATVVASGSAGDHHITTYFRHHFNVTDPGTVGALTLYLRRDDGAAAYLNGSEILRTNLSDAAGSETTASSTTSGSAERHFVASAVNPDLLVAGDNVLAVEAHLDSATSPDLSFDLELVTSGDPGPPALERTPYLQVGTASSMVVRWRTDVPSDGRLRWGPAPGNLPNEVSTPVFRHEHEFEITGLDPATKYFYSVGTTTQTLAGDDADHFFHTSPPAGAADPIRIWAIGDSGDCSRVPQGCIDAAKVRDAYLGFAGADTAELMVMLGDNAYSSGSHPEYNRGLWDPFGAVLRNTVLWPVPGNHEFGGSDSPTQSGPYYLAFTLPTAAEAGGVASGTEAYYSYDHGNVHLVALDSHDTDRSAPANPTTNICPGGQGGAMYQWLCADLASTTADWVIVYWHHPPYSKGGHDSDDPLDSDGRLQEMRERFVPVLEHFGVDLQLTGHSHSYERSVLIDGHYGHSSECAAGECFLDGGDGDPAGDGAYQKATLGPAPHEGAIYSVVGSSSKNTAGLLAHPVMSVGINYEGSLVIDVSGSQLDATFVDMDGVVGDRYRIVKGNVPPPCADGVDNDGDTFVDTADPGCRNAEWTSESPQCNDGVDNDGDGRTDLDDPQCGNAWQLREKRETCGLGWELALVLPLLAAWRSRRRARR